MPWAFLLAFQASGMIIDYLGTRHQQLLSEMGARAEQSGIEANIQQTRLETEQASLQAMRNLRQTMGTQIAAFAARGTATNAGSSLTALTESLSNFNSDERVRRLNAMGKENQLRGGAAISRLNSMSENSKLWQGFGTRTLNRFPSSYSGWKQAYADVQEGFGLTKVK
jgi:hypothetical protein